MAALCLAALLLAACAHSSAYVERRNREHRLEIDEYNCRWEKTHVQDAKGELKEVEIGEEELERAVHECLKAKGYFAEQPAEGDATGEGTDGAADGKKKDSGSWWWPF
ncbi:MAG: hypothetical protein H0S85_05560 [Desulfovibrionaceae bacterium]|nr:hypothetical protein [Desulfovibrionaceae bacterium]